MALHDFITIEDIMPIDYDAFNDLRKDIEQKHIERHGGLYMIDGKPIKSILELWEWQKNNSDSSVLNLCGVVRF